MVEALKIEELKQKYSSKIVPEDMEKLMNLNPGESYAIAFSQKRKDDVFFVRVSQQYMAIMNIHEYNGVTMTEEV